MHKMAEQQDVTVNFGYIMFAKDLQQAVVVTIATQMTKISPFP